MAARVLAHHVVFPSSGGWRLFDNFLMAALQAALAFPQLNRVSVAVRENLDLDVTGTAQIALDQQGVVAERSPRLTPGRSHRLRKIARLLDQPHALARHPRPRA